MRIGIDASFLRKPGTGIGQVTLNFLQTLKSFPSDGTEYVIYTENGYDRSSYPEHFQFRNFLPALWRRDDLIRKMLWERRVMKEAAKDGCDAFLSLYQSSSRTPKGMHHVMVVHDIIPALFPEYQGNMRQKCSWKMIERGIRTAARIVAVSDSTRHDLIVSGIDPEKIVVASPSCSTLFDAEPDAMENSRVLKKYGLVPGYFYHGGGLEVRKNTGRLLSAYAGLLEKEKSGTLSAKLPPLVISGKIFSESNPLATPVKKLVRELQLEEKVALLDFVPEQDLPALYKNALCFVYPSLYEGFGVPVLEALRMGVPVLTSDNSSLPEVAGDAALYVDAGHAESIASGMERMLTDEELRKDLVAKGERQAEKFSWKSFVTTIIETLKI